MVEFQFGSGHGSFSNNPKLNSVVGHFLHSSILVPYHGWYDTGLANLLFGIMFMMYFGKNFIGLI